MCEVGVDEGICLLIQWKQHTLHLLFRRQLKVSGTLRSLAAWLLSLTINLSMAFMLSFMHLCTTGTGIILAHDFSFMSALHNSTPANIFH